MATGLALLGIFVIDVTISYMAIVFGMLQGAAFAQRVEVTFIAVNCLCNALAVLFAIKAKRRAAFASAAAPVPISILIIIISSLMPLAAKSEGAKSIERCWTEDVKLSSGEQITAKRWEKYRPVHEPGHEPGALINETRIEANLPGAGELVWQTSLSPWLLDKSVDGFWYLVGKTMTLRGSKEYGIYVPIGGLRSPEFVAYRLVDHTWQRITVSEFPQDLKVPNLLVYSGAAFDPKHAFYHGPSGSAYAFDDTKNISIPDLEPIVNGGLIDLPYKAKINFPSHPDQRPIFRVTSDLFDDGIRYIRYECKLNSSDCAWVTLERGLDERFGRAPHQQ